MQYKVATVILTQTPATVTVTVVTTKTPATLLKHDIIQRLIEDVYVKQLD